MSDLNVNITMKKDTVEALQTDHFHLFAFRAVETDSEGGLPVVWFDTDTYSDNESITWQEYYEAFASKSETKSGALISASCSREIDLGKKMEVKGNIQCSDSVKGPDGCISVWNNRDSPLPSCGISEKDKNGKVAPLCAFPLFGGNAVMIKPIKKVFLMFANKPLVTKTVISQSVGPGLIIDLTDNQTRNVSYEHNTGWSWDEKEGHAEKYPALSDLAPRLVLPSQSMKENARRINLK